MIAKPFPCAFCGGDMLHIESLAKSFTPARVYHEYHHPDNECVLSGYRVNFDDNPEPRVEWLQKWNTRK